MDRWPDSILSSDSVTARLSGAVAIRFDFDNQFHAERRQALPVEVFTAIVVRNCDTDVINEHGVSPGCYDVTLRLCQ